MANFIKDLHRLMKRVKRVTDGQAAIEDVDWTNPDGIDRFIVNIEPNAGLYKGGIFRFEIRKSFYNDCKPPRVQCLSGILHPNIEDGEICLNILQVHKWLPSIGLEGVVLGLLFLLHDPNFNDPLAGVFDQEYQVMSHEERDRMFQDYYNGELEEYRFIKANAGHELADGESTGLPNDNTRHKRSDATMDCVEGNAMNIETAVQIYDFPTDMVERGKSESEGASSLRRSASLVQLNSNQGTLKSSHSCFPYFCQNIDLFKTKKDEPSLKVFDGETVLMF